ncbi:MAG: hypothetical protein H6Q02_650 [Acidobacteria bacterium]|nr:hypothetical protein [Acidobacteriota bacterium]
MPGVGVGNAASPSAAATPWRMRPSAATEGVGVAVARTTGSPSSPSSATASPSFIALIFSVAAMSM